MRPESNLLEKFGKYRQVAGLVLVLIFAIYHCGLTLFPHSHTFGDGTVTHSHPYLPGTSHNHTASQLQLISEAAATPVCEPGEAVSYVPFRHVTAVIITPVKDCVGWIAEEQPSLRAPPVTD